MPPTYISGLLTRFLFFDHRNDLFVRKSCLHLSVLLLGGLYTKLEEFWGLRSDLQAVTEHTEIIDGALRRRIDKGIAHITKDLDPDNAELVDLRQKLRAKEEIIRDLGDAIFARIT